MADRRAVVVGAGIAGLTAAYRLQQAGWEVEVLEARSRVGGRMITLHWKDLTIDPGAEFVTGADRYVRALARDLGIEEQLVDFSDLQTGFEVNVMRGGEVHSVNFMSVLSYLRWKGVSLGARLSMLKLLPHMLRYSRTPANHPDLAPGEDRGSMQDFFYERINAEMFDYWLEPTMDVFCGYVAEDLSDRMMLHLLGNYLNQKLYTFEGGVGLLPETLAERLRVTTDARVSQVVPRAAGATVHYRVGEEERTQEADAVVLAVPGDAVLPLLASPYPAWESFFSQVDYSRVGIVYYQLDQDDFDLEDGGIMFPRREPWKITALGWEQQEQGVRLMITPKAYLYESTMSDEALVSLLKGEALRAMPRLEGLLEDPLIFRWERKVPTYRAGYLAALRRFKAEPQEGPLYFCGDYLAGASAGAALASAWECADRVEGHGIV